MTEPKTICIDFDQTICDSVYPNVGPPKEGVRDALLELREMGFRIIISSCRSCSWNWELYYGDAPHTPAYERSVYTDMLNWLKEYDIPFDVVDDGTKGKVSASYYVDDKGIRFCNWRDTMSTIRKYEERLVSGT